MEDVVEHGRGLTSQEAAARLRSDGPNELPRADRRTLARIAVDVIAEPMFGLLIGAGIIYLLLGDLGEALLLLAFTSLSVGIAIIQEGRSERVLEALADLTSPRALVVRDGKRQRIAGREVVRGDLVVLGEGDRVPADARLLSSHDLQTDESLLTGESVPVRKRAGNGASASSHPGGDDLPFVFSGTLVVRGHGSAEVTATGERTEIGKIGLSLRSIERAPTRLTMQTRRLVRAMAALGLTASAVLVVAFGLAHGDWLAALLGGIALSMSMLPQEFPLVLTVFMVMGAWRISRIGVLTRRAAAIETLGAATVLCTDKTGTLTQNRMTVVELRSAAGDAFRPSGAAGGTLSAALRNVLEAGVLASAANPLDPMERAIHELWRGAAASETDAAAGRRLIHEYPLRPELLAVCHAWAEEDDVQVFAKGAPEAVAALCRIDAAVAGQLHRQVGEMAAEGIRVLAVARASFAASELPPSPHGFDFSFLGLIGLADPLRPSVPDAVRECRSAGIRVVMITGDYPATARAIATQAGIDAGDIVTGDELAAMPDGALAARLRSATVFARTRPEQKLRIVGALKANGEIVAMTGDGVNDAPALKAADIGIAMGGRGTDVAREAASIVVLDDDFGSIVRTVRLGRRIYDNLRKAIGYILAMHVPIAGLALLPLLFGFPLIFAPIHIAFLEMVIDPVCSIVFEAETEERDVMDRPPRNPRSALFAAPLVAWSLVQGALGFLVVAIVFVVALKRGMPEDEVRALAFTSLVLTNMGLILVNRSFSTSLASALRRPNRALWVVLGVAGALLVIAVTWPPAERLFRFGALHADDLLVTCAAGTTVLIVLEMLKPIWRNRLRD